MAPKVMKAKKPLSAKAKAKLRAAKVAAKQAAIESGEIVAPVPKKDDRFKKQVLAALAGRSVQEAAEEFKKKTQLAKAELQEAQAMEKAQQQQVDEAQGEVDKAKATIAEQQRLELEAAAAYKEIVGKRAVITKTVHEARNELYEAQKKVAMLEVLAVNHAKMKMLEETRKAAQQAAEEAKKTMLEQKQREKDALEATRKALAEARAEQKGLGKGAKKRKTEDETLPATQADGQAADID